VESQSDRISYVFRFPATGASFHGVPGDKDLQDALMQQLRVQTESQTLKEEIQDDLKNKVEDMKQISEEVGALLDSRTSFLLHAD